MSVETIERPTVGGADPTCFCNALHLPYTELLNGFGHCMCNCHTPGEHVAGAPCPCNSTRGKEQEWRNS